MRSVSATFHRFDRVSLWNVLQNTGVYVLWTEQGRRGPSYIGEGDLVNRLGSHSHSAKGPIDGVVALTEDKEEARLVEAALLWCADEMGVRPRGQIKIGQKTLKDCCGECSLLKVHIRGQDPMRAPSSPVMTGTKTIEFELDEDGELLFSMPWNRR